MISDTSYRRQLFHRDLLIDGGCLRLAVLVSLLPYLITNKGATVDT